MTFPIDATIPLGVHDPSDDVTPMRNNFSNIKSFLAVDHITAGATGAGKHEQITFKDKTAQVAQVDPQSILYTKSGVASVGAELNFLNENGTFPSSCVKAFAIVTGGVGPTILNKVNVTSVSRSGTGNYSVVLPPNIVSGTSFVVIISSNMASNFSTGVLPGYVITGVGTFEINFKALTGTTTGADPTNFSFLVLQA